MNLLALDTSSVACSVALRVGDTVVERYEERPREHTQLLMPMIREVLRDSGAALSDLDAIVLGNGPGSFIGVRIAASVAQGLAHGAGVVIVPVSSLAAVAVQVFAEGDATEVAVAQDAHMSEVYLGLYRRGEDNLPLSVMDERLQAQTHIAETTVLAAGSRVAAGEGWQRYPVLFAENSAAFSAQSGVLYPRAKYLLPLAVGAAGIAPTDVEPAYLRRQVAKKPPQPQP